MLLLMLTNTYLLVIMFNDGIMHHRKGPELQQIVSEPSIKPAKPNSFCLFDLHTFMERCPSFLPPPVVESHSVVVNILWLKVHFLGEQKGIITARLKAHK